MASRSRQIASLQQVPTAQCLASDSSKWRARAIDASGNTACVINIDLPLNFPQMGPVIHASPVVRHHWVEATGRVTGHPALRPWSPMSSLGSVICDIQRELAGVAGPKSTPVEATTPAKSCCVEAAASSSSGPARAPLERERTPAPAIPTAFPSLNALSVDELEKLQSDPAALSDWIADLEMAVTYDSMVSELRESNAALAKSQLGRKEVVETRQQECEKAQRIAEEKHAEVVELAKQKDSLASRYEPSMLCDALRSKLKEQNEAADRLGKELTMEKRTGLEFRQALSEYTELKKVAHRHAVKRERLIYGPEAVAGSSATAVPTRVPSN